MELDRIDRNLAKMQTAGASKEEMQMYLNSETQAEATPVQPQPQQGAGPSYIPGEAISVDASKAEAGFFDMPVSVPEKLPKWMEESPNAAGIYGAGKGLIEQAVRPAVQATGAVGGALATPATPTVGGAFGYGIAEKSMDIVSDAYKRLGGEPVPERTIPGELARSAKDVGAFYALGKGMDVAAIGLSKAEAYLFDTLPKRLYASGAKMPLGAKWLKELPGKEISKRTAATEEALRAETNISEFGLLKAKNLEKESKLAVDDVITELAKNKGNMIETENVLQEGLKRAYQKASKSSDPVGAKLVIDDIAERFRAHGETLDPIKANEVKRQLYKEVSWMGAEPTGITGQVTASAKKGIAHQLMNGLEGFYPELQAMNATDAARIDLVTALERSVGRLENTDILPLSAKVLARPWLWPMALWDATVGHPQIKAQLAFTLAKGNPAKYGNLARYGQKTLGEVPEAYTGTLVDEGLMIEWKPEYSTTKIQKAWEKIGQEQPYGAETIPLESRQGMPLMKPANEVLKSTIPSKLKTDILNAMPLDMPITQVEIGLRPDQRSLLIKIKEKPESKVGMPLIKPKPFSPGSYK